MVLNLLKDHLATPHYRLLLYYMIQKVLQDMGIDLLDSEILLAHVLGKDRSWLLAHPDTPLS